MGFGLGDVNKNYELKITGCGSGHLIRNYKFFPGSDSPAIVPPWNSRIRFYSKIPVPSILHYLSVAFL